MNTVVLDRSQVKIGISHYVAISLYLGWIGFYPLCIALPLLFFLCLPIILISATSTVKRKSQPKMGKAFGKWIMNKSSEYLGLKVLVSNREAVDKAGPSIVVIEPHDVLPLGMIAFHDTHHIFPHQKMLAATSSALFQIPVMKHILTWCDAISVGKKSLVSSLKKGYSVVLCPGGAHEVVFMKDKKDVVLYMKERKGVVKLCLEQGKPLIPSFCFGQRQLYNFWVPPFEWIHNMTRPYGYVPVFFSGYFGIPLAPPKPSPLTVVIGNPLNIPHIAEPTDEDIAKYHTLLLQAMENLFENNKEVNGMGECTLRIV